MCIFLYRRARELPELRSRIFSKYSLLDLGTLVSHHDVCGIRLFVEPYGMGPASGLRRSDDMQAK